MLGRVGKFAESRRDGTVLTQAIQLMTPKLLPRLQQSRLPDIFFTWLIRTRHQLPTSPPCAVSSAASKGLHCVPAQATAFPCE